MDSGSGAIPMAFNAHSQFAAVLLFALACGLCAADERAERTDSYGDPLPAGAIARLGTSRLQHGGQIDALIYSPDGKWLASAGADPVIRIWDAETGKAALSLEGHQAAVRGLAFVPVGEGKPAKVLVSASRDKTIRFWNVTTGKELPLQINHPGAATAVAVSPDGKLLASGGAPEPHVILWKVEDGTEVRRWKAHQGGVVALAFAPDGKTIASGGKSQSFPPRAGGPKDDYGVALWETDTGTRRHTFASHLGAVSAIAFAADGKLLASSGFDHGRGRSVLLWDPETGKEVRALGGKFGLSAQCLALSGDAKVLAAGEHHTIKFFDTGTATEQHPLTTPGTDDLVQAVAFSPDNATLATANYKGRIMLWDVARRTAKLAPRGHSQPLTSVAVSPDGKTIATTSLGEPAFLWDRATGKVIRSLEQKSVAGVAVVWCAAFSPDGRTVALAHQREGITFWDMQTGRLRRRIPEKRSDRIVSLVFSPNGKRLASESIDQPHASVWDTATGELVRTFARGTQPYHDQGFSVTFSPDGRLLASTATNGLNVWELESGKLVFPIRDCNGKTVAFSPGGWLVSTAGPAGVRVFDGVDGKELAKFDSRSHPSARRGIAFSPDGRLLAAADANRVKLWDVSARRELAGFEGHRGIVTSVAFGPDGTALVSAAEDGTALIWDLDGVIPELKSNDPKLAWEELRHSDRFRAYAAFCRLRASPDDALKLIDTNLGAAAAMTADRLGDLIKKLDNDSFQVREQATQELKQLGAAAEKALRRAAQNSPSLEASKRIENLLADLDPGADWQRTRTALQLLQELPLATARELLQKLAKGDPDSRLTREAKTILQRVLERRREPGP